jgi:hypothetical protein
MRPLDSLRPRVRGDSCPRCGSSVARRLSLIYREATAFAPHAHGLGDGIGSPAETPVQRARRTQLSRQVAPPARKHDLLWSFAAVIAGVIGFATATMPDARTIVAFGILGLALFSAVQARRYNRDTFPRLHTQWAHSLMCQRCGNVFEEQQPSAISHRPSAS